MVRALLLKRSLCNENLPGNELKNVASSGSPRGNVTHKTIGHIAIEMTFHLFLTLASQSHTSKAFA